MQQVKVYRTRNKITVSPRLTIDWKACATITVKIGENYAYGTHTHPLSIHRHNRDDVKRQKQREKTNGLHYIVNTHTFHSRGMKLAKTLYYKKIESLLRSGQDTKVNRFERVLILMGVTVFEFVCFFLFPIRSIHRAIPNIVQYETQRASWRFFFHITVLVPREIFALWRSRWINERVNGTRDSYLFSHDVLASYRVNTNFLTRLERRTRLFLL